MGEHFWEAICLLIFVGLIYKPTKKAILEYLDSYSAGVKAKIVEANSIVLEAHKTLQYYLRQHKNLKNKVDTLKKNTKSSVSELIRLGEESLKEKIQQKQKLHIARLEISRKEIQQRVKVDTMAKSIAIATTYIQDNLKQDVTKEDLDFITAAVNKKNIILH